MVHITLALANHGLSKHFILCKQRQLKHEWCVRTTQINATDSSSQKPFLQSFCIMWTLVFKIWLDYYELDIYKLETKKASNWTPKFQKGTWIEWSPIRWCMWLWWMKFKHTKDSIFRGKESILSTNSQFNSMFLSSEATSWTWFWHALFHVHTWYH